MNTTDQGAEQGQDASRRRLTVATLANVLRRVFDRFARRFDSVTVVSVLAGAAVAVAAVQLWLLERKCKPFPISLIKLEVTFFASRFATILDEAPRQCQSNVATSLVTTDLAFPVFYAAAISALFIWAERWRWVLPDSTRVRPEPDVGLGRHLAVLAPFAAGLLDLGENVFLWRAATWLMDDPTTVTSVKVRVLVFLGSAVSALKWSLLLFSACAIVIELLSGPRGIVLRRLRFSLLSVALGALPLLLVPQGRDILQRLVEGEHPYVRVFFAAIPAVLLAALAVWYCGRKIVQFRTSMVFDESEQQWYDHFARHTPRVLGIALIVITGAAFAGAGLALARFLGVAVVGYLLTLRLTGPTRDGLAWLGRPIMLGRWKSIPSFDDRIGRAMVATIVGVFAWLPHRLPTKDGCWIRPCASDEPELAIWSLRIAAWLCLVLAWAFYLHVYFRRPRRECRGVRAVEPTHDAVAPADVSGGLKAGVLVTAVASLLALAVFAAFPVTVGRGIGPLWILAITAANAVFVGSLTVWVYERYKVRLVTLSIIVAVMFSLWNDNHVVRKLEGTGGAVARRSTIAAHLGTWVDSATMARADDTPVFLVASAGGGLRAAYWAAASLAAAQDSSPAFARHLFAASGVSGGSLGVALFAALIRDANGAVDSLPCGRDPRTETRARATFGPYSACARYFLRDDFLSPVLAKFVAPDIAQWFLPIPVQAFDRATALEESWEASYDSTAGRRTFSEAFLDLARPRTQGGQLPSLFLNATHVETGQRYIASHLVRDTAAGARSMLASRDLLDVLGSDLRLSTAVHNSARFTYVSPAGRLVGARGTEHGHVVDGGYFENSGLETLGEVSRIVRSYSRGGLVLRPVVLYLCNDPIPCARELAGDTLIRTGGDIAGEWLAPLRAVLDARGARGALARAELRSTPDLEFLQLNVCDNLGSSTGAPARKDTVAADSSTLAAARTRVVAPPLGWLLSRLARDWMDSSLTGTPNDHGACRDHNAFVLHRIRELLRAAPPLAAGSHPAVAEDTPRSPLPNPR
jgi:hypothetical protein